MAKSAWGIEVGTSTIKAVNLSSEGKGGVSLNDIGMVSLAGFRVEGGDENAAVLGALVQLVHEKDIRPNDTVYISLPGRNAFSRVITLPPVSEDSIRETIANEARGQIPIKLEEAVWSYQRIHTESGETQVNLYAVKREVVDSLVRTCKAAGLNINGIQLAPLGIYNFVKYELDADVSNGCVCIDIGGENTDLLIVDKEKTWIRVVPFAGNDLTKALLMKDKRLKPEIAETLKRDPQRTVAKFNENGQDKIWRDVASVLEAVKTPMREMVSEIQRSVGYYKNQNEGSDFNKLVIMGNGSKMLNISKFLGQQLQYEVHPVAELSSISVSRMLDASIVAQNVQALVVAIGLGLQGLGLPGLATTNLLPDDYAKEEARQKSRPAAIAAGALVLLAGIGSFVMGNTEKTNAEAAIGSIDSFVAQASTFQTNFNREASKLKALSFDFERVNNMKRGANLITATTALTMDAINETNEKVLETFKVPLMPSRYPESGSAERAGHGLNVREIRNDLIKAPDKAPEGETDPWEAGGNSEEFLRNLARSHMKYIDGQPDPKEFTRYGRSRMVRASLNFVMERPEGMSDGESPTINKTHVSDVLRNAIIARLSAVAMPLEGETADARRSEFNSRVSAAFSKSFAANTAHLDLMWELRSLLPLPQLPPPGERSPDEVNRATDATRELINVYMVEPSAGRLLVGPVDYAEAFDFDTNNGVAPQLNDSTYFDKYPRYFQFTQMITLVSTPWSLTPEAEAK